MAVDVKEKPASQPSKNEAFIAKELAKAEQRIRFVDLATGAAMFVAGTLLFGIVAMLLDSRFVLSVATRQVFFLLWLAGAGLWLFIGVIRPLREKVNPYFAARQLESTLESDRNHVINWIDLKNEKAPGVLRSVLNQKAAKDLQKADLDEAISNRRVVLASSAAVLLLVIFVTMFVMFRPGPFSSLFSRTFLPFGKETAIATKTRPSIIRPDGGDALVTLGNPVTIVAHIDGVVPKANADDAPCLWYRHDEKEPWRKRLLQADESQREWATTIGPLDVGSSGFAYGVTAGDGTTPEYRISTRSSPLIGEFLATYVYRPYTQKAKQTRESRKLEDLRGTQVQILARTNRTLKDGRLDFDGKDGVTTFTPAKLRADDPQTLRFEFKLEQSGKYRIRYTSTEGELYVETVSHEVVVIDDLAPIVRITEPAPQITVPANAAVVVKGEIADDIGIRNVALRMRLEGGAELTPKAYLKDKLGTETFGTPRRLDYRDTIELATLKDLKGQAVELKKGTRIEYWLEAADACDVPKPNVTASAPPQVWVIDAEDKSAEQDKKNKKAQEEQKGHDKNQEDQAKQEKGERDAQKEKDAANEAAAEKDREKKDGGAGEEKGKEKGGGEKGKDEDKGGAGQQEGKQPEKPDDEKTKREAERLQEALNKNQDKNSEDKPGKEKKEGEDKKGEGAKDGGNDKGKGAAEKKDEGKENPGEGKNNPGEGKGPGKEQDDKKGEGKEGSPDKGDGAGKEPKKGEAKSGEPKPGNAPPGEGRGEGKETDRDPMKEGSEEAKNAKGEGKPSKQDPKSKPGEAKPTSNPDGKPGSCKECKDGSAQGNTPGAGKGSGKAPDKGPNQGPGKGKEGDNPEKSGPGNNKVTPENARPADAKDRADELGSGDPGKVGKAVKDLQDMKDKAKDPATRQAAKEALEEFEKNQKEGMDKAKPMGKKEDKPDGPGPGKEKGGKKADPTNQVNSSDGMGKNAQAGDPMGNQGGGERQPNEGNADEDDSMQGEKPAAHRPTMIQLEEFRKKVDPKILKDAKMSQEQYEKFLKDYADLARRHAAKPEVEKLPGVGRGGTGNLGSMGGKAIKSGQGTDTLRNDGRAKPPPEYRDAHSEFLRRLETPGK